MKIKLDENVPSDLILSADVDTVEAEGLAGRDDQVVWQAAQTEERFFITQDLDFSDLRRFTPGTHHGILLIRLRTPSRAALTRRIEQIFREEAADSWTGCFVVATDSKLRVRSPRGRGPGEELE